jgi:hypothetical protein
VILLTKPALSSDARSPLFLISSLLQRLLRRLDLRRQSTSVQTYALSREDCLVFMSGDAGPLRFAFSPRPFFLRLKGGSLHLLVSVPILIYFPIERGVAKFVSLQGVHKAIQFLSDRLIGVIRPSLGID